MDGEKSLRASSGSRLAVVARALFVVAVVSLAVMAGTASAAFSGVAGWGTNGIAQLGTGSDTGPEACGSPCAKVPVAVGGLSGAKSLEGGAYHGLAVLNDGAVMAWGDNALGQLGIGNETGPEVCGSMEIPCSKSPVSVSGLTEAEAVAAGETFSLALLEDGTVMAWGTNYRGQLGDGTTAERNAPAHVQFLNDVVAIAAGQAHALALLEDGTVMAWGSNNAGQLGDGSITDSDTPVPVSGLSDVVAIAAGPAHSLAVLENGTVMSWGSNHSGQLGNGSSTGPETCKAKFDPEVPCSRTPIAVSNINEAIDVAAGGDQGSNGRSYAVMQNGTVRAWGDNNGGQLGNGTLTGPEVCGQSETACSEVPVAVSGIAEAEAVTAGWGHNLALLEDGTVMAWGFNQFGQLGDGTTDDSLVPVEVDGLSGVSTIGAGAWTSFTNGSVASLPTIMKLEPNYGLITGGTAVTITGTDFTGATAVKFGSSNAASFIVNSATSITAVSPPGTGTPNVRVTTLTGTSSTSDATVFYYSPVVTKVEPNDGVQAGGTYVTIKGGNFTGASAVKFGSNDAESFVVNSDTTITAVSPPDDGLFGGPEGIVHVRVTGPGGTSPVSDADKFGYGPIVDQVSPRRGPAAGGTEVTITGFALEEVEAVHFGSTPAASFTENPDGSVTAVTPAFVSGSASGPVVVTTPTGDSTTTQHSSILTENYFTFGPTVTGVNPGEGPEGSTVTIHGTGFHGVKGSDEFPFVESISFGSNEITCSSSFNPWGSCSPVTFEVKSETEIVATVPAGAGTVDVAVTTHGGASPLGSADKFTYEAPPTILNVSATSITQHSATLNAEINPNGRETTYKFQIDPKGAYNFPRSDSCILHPPGVVCAQEVIPGESPPKGLVEPPEANIPVGNDPVKVSIDLASIGATLEAGRTYQFRVLATNDGGQTIVDHPSSFTTEPPVTCAFASGSGTCDGGGPGNPKPKPRKCKKGKKLKHGKCVKKKSHRHHKKHRRHKHQIMQ